MVCSSAPPPPSALETVPFEILEQIALATIHHDSHASNHNHNHHNAAISSILGPPSHLTPLLLTSSRFNNALSITANPHIYARMFATKFDTDQCALAKHDASSVASSSNPFRWRGCGLSGVAALRRVQKQQEQSLYLDEPDVEHRLTPNEVLATELRLRFTVLRRLRARKPIHNPTTLLETLWTVYFMLLEGDCEGKNYAQLRDYAQLGEWLKEYFFGECSSSAIKNAMERDVWPKNREEISLAVWIFWMFFQEADYIDPEMSKYGPRLFKLFCLGAHKFPLTTVPWTSFSPRPDVDRCQPAGSTTSIDSMSLYGLTSPPIGPPAILIFMTFHNRGTRPTGILTETAAIIPPNTSTCDASKQWKNQWARAVFGYGGALGWDVSSSHSAFGDDLEMSSYQSPSPASSTPTSRSSSTSSSPLLAPFSLPSLQFPNSHHPGALFTPGALSGVWEGYYAYTEIQGYAQLLCGAPPSHLQYMHPMKHRATWRATEWYLTKSSERHLLEEESANQRRFGASSRSSSSSSLASAMSGSSRQGSSGSTSAYASAMSSPPSSPLLSHPSSSSHLPLPAHTSAAMLRAFSPLRARRTPPPERLTPGPANRAFVPQGAQMTVHSNGEFLDVWDPVKQRNVRYSRTVKSLHDDDDEDDMNSDDGLDNGSDGCSVASDDDVLHSDGGGRKEKVFDVLITGEGHSAWGQFKVSGRVRPSDGLFCLRKEYTDEMRGQWIYRGYVVGEEHGSCVGRWRDTTSDLGYDGYEGCFVMNRRV